jgi:hypothetical protein
MPALPQADGLPLKPVCDKECPNEASYGNQYIQILRYKDIP